VSTTKQYHVYIMTNRSRTLYIGVTNDLERRVNERRYMVKDGFSGRYLTDRLVYYESTGDVTSAIAREKQLKGWLRSRKIALIESMNPEWNDLGAELFGKLTAETLRSSG
jgi:putative endonuclease